MVKVISVDQLRVGMFISDENTEWVPEGNRTKSGLIRRPEVIEKIRARGIDYITIDPLRGEDVLEVAASQPSEDSFGWQAKEVTPRPVTKVAEVIAQQEQSGVSSPSAPQVSVSLEDEQDKAKRIHGEALKVVDGVMDKVRSGTSIDVKEVEDVAEQLVDSIFRNQNALACLSRIRDKDQYLMEHSLNVGILLSILGKSMGFDLATVRKLAVGGMLHDIGKVQVPDEILHKPGKLEADEWETMKLHVNFGEAYLDQIAVDQMIIKICAQHHERLDSTGYPRRLSKEAISLYGRMAAVCDVYDAITADRVYHKGMTPTVAMKRLVEWSDDHLDRKLVYQFIRALSIYPVGSLVLLESGCLAIVIEPNPIQQSQPRVRVVYHSKLKQFLPVEDLDLAQTGEDEKILKAVDPERLEVKIPIMDFI
ncbi:HDIG domain-containing protein [Marinospirillum celere]|uniref:HDIG domain-containing protein n=1 Tax=Marinospirillum celere TaxID=1122252 RepID=A0A1I1EKP3_9GAMM|nr:HD-GYP domain-containing protein [Marinospirillum celere]SFB86038.1 HDIG domain-containing protein [Marinospirillum celere]